MHLLREAVVLSTKFVLLVALPACGMAETDRTLPPGWERRLDDSEADAIEVRLVRDADGVLVDNGPNAILWQTSRISTGRYRLSVEVEHLHSKHGHHHGAGLFFGGSDLDRDSQRYSYFLVRSDGKFLAKRRDASETVVLSESWTEHAAIARQNVDTGIARNVLTIEVGDGDTMFLVNGSEVFRTTNESLHTSGLFGLRIVHDQTVRFGGLQSTPLGGA